MTKKGLQERIRALIEKTPGEAWTTREIAEVLEAPQARVAKVRSRMAVPDRSGLKFEVPALVGIGVLMDGARFRMRRMGENLAHVRQEGDKAAERAILAHLRSLGVLYGIGRGMVWNMVPGSESVLVLFRGEEL